PLCSMPPCHHAIMTPCHHVTMLPPHHVTMSPCFHLTMSPCHHASTSPCHHVTMLPPHHAAMPPWLHPSISPRHHGTMQVMLRVGDLDRAIKFYEKVHTPTCASHAIPPIASLCPMHAATHPAVTHPAATHPAVTHPAATHPAVTHPAATHPAVTHPAATHPAVTHPAATHPAVTHPAATHPAVTHPAATHPAATHPAVTHPTVTHPAVTHPAATHPAVTHPAATHPAATQSHGVHGARIVNPMLKCTCCHARAAMHLLPCTCCHAPVTMHLLPCTCCHASAAMHVLPCTCCHAPAAMHLLPCTCCHAPPPLSDCLACDSCLIRLSSPLPPMVTPPWFMCLPTHQTFRVVLIIAINPSSASVLMNHAHACLQAYGMKLLRTRDNPQYKYTIAMVGYGPEAESAVVELTYNYGVESYDKGNAYAQIAIGTDDVYKTAEAIRAAGGTITREPGPIPGINTKIVACLDPDGYKTVFVDNKDFLRELE
ncbi:unnamed protein product, partial [Closterium sp. NIES-53]